MDHNWVVVPLLLLAAACRTAPGWPTETAGDASTGDATPASPTGVTITVEPDGTGVAQPLLTAIEGAQAAVHVEMYLLTNDVYIDALETLEASGVDVKVVLNETFPAGTARSDTNAASYATLDGAGVPVHWAPTDTGFAGYTHEKAVIIDPGTDNAQAWIMTMNLDHDAPVYNREYLARDMNGADIAEAEAIFEADFAGEPITPTGSLVVAPSPQNNAAATLLQLIESATESIDMEAEEFDDAGLEAQLFSALNAQAQAGVMVRLVIEDSTDEEQATAVGDLVAAGGMVVGYRDGSALDIHAKAIVVDGARAYVGSENFSGGSLEYNRELGVVFTEPAEVAKVGSAIASDFQAGSAYARD